MSELIKKISVNGEEYGIHAESVQDGAVTNGKIADKAINANKVMDRAITTSKIGLDAVQVGNIMNGAVTTPKISDGSVTKEKLDTELRDALSGYHDDGSGQLVPIKHPDLSTQPSILPYKFMGQYVYEQLVFLGTIDANNRSISKTIAMSTLSVEKAVIISCEGFAYGQVKAPYGTNQSSRGNCGLPISLTASFESLPYSLYEPERFGLAISVSLPESMWVGGSEESGFVNEAYVYARIVYTTMPEDSSYYGYETGGGEY